MLLHMLLALTLAAQEPEGLEREVKANPTAQNWQKLGLTRHLRNEYGPAVEAFRHAVRLDPKLWTSELFLGIGLYRTNQFTEALKALERADPMATGQGRDEVDYWLGATRIALKQPLAGLRSLEKLLSRRPDHAAGLELAARAYSDESSALWNYVGENHFETPQGQHVHGFAMASEGDPESAEAAFRKSLGLAPNRRGPRREIGGLLLNKGRAVEALAMLSKEAAVARTDWRTYHLGGLAALQAGHSDEVVRWFEVAVRWSNADAEPAIALAQVLLGRKNFSGAVGAASRAVELAPGSVAAHELLVTSLEQAGEPVRLQQEVDRWQRRGGQGSPNDARTPASLRP